MKGGDRAEKRREEHRSFNKNPRLGGLYVANMKNYAEISWMWGKRVGA